MNLSTLQNRPLLHILFACAVGFFAIFPAAQESAIHGQAARSSASGIVKGVIRDEQGNPVSNAIIAVFRSSKLLKQVKASQNGSFLTKLVPGSYSVIALAEGFNSGLISNVQVGRATENYYGIKLERSGGGRTLPEKRADRDSAKWRIRAAQSRRSIYQAKESAKPAELEEETIASADQEEASRKGRTIAETYTASNDGEIYQGFNFAMQRPLGKSAEITIAGQAGTGKSAPKRAEAGLKFRAAADHQIRLNTSFSQLGRIPASGKQLSQLSLQASDEIRLKKGVIIVVGFDYSRFLGAGGDSSLSPRLGLQLDIDPKTRFSAAYTAQNEERTWQKAIELEDSNIIFRDPLPAGQIAISEEKPIMNKSRRLEFGVERILDNSSNIEAAAFFDAVSGRGVGLANVPFQLLSIENPENFVANQQGKTSGFRVVYSRRISKTFSAAAGFAAGKGQKATSKQVSCPADIFENAFFQSFFGQLSANLRNGAKVKTIFRLSPDATVFAIDPFQGRLAIYDPGLSVVVSQPLPNLGFPIRAEATIDAHNILDMQNGENGTIRLSNQRRMLRGGISVRF